MLFVKQQPFCLCLHVLKKNSAQPDLDPWRPTSAYLKNE